MKKTSDWCFSHCSPWCQVLLQGHRAVLEIPMSLLQLGKEMKNVCFLHSRAVLLLQYPSTIPAMWEVTEKYLAHAVCLFILLPGMSECWAVAWLQMCTALVWYYFRSLNPREWGIGFLIVCFSFSFFFFKKFSFFFFYLYLSYASGAYWTFRALKDKWKKWHISVYLDFVTTTFR